MRREPLPAVLLLALGCGHAAAPRPEPPRDDEAVLEAVYRWQIADLASRGAPMGEYFLSDARGGDPSEAFVQRFSDLSPRPRRKSESEAAPDAGIRDRATGARGGILSVRGIEWRADGTVEVRVQVYAGPEGAEGATLILAPQGPAWTVREARDRWIS